MIIFGHNLITSSKFVKISNKDDILKTNPNDILLVDFGTANIELIKYLDIQNLKYAININTITEMLISIAYNPNYLIVKQELAKKAQKIADDYVLDTKIIQIIESEDELQSCANDIIDGVVFKWWLDL